MSMEVRVCGARPGPFRGSRAYDRACGSCSFPSSAWLAPNPPAPKSTTIGPEGRTLTAGALTLTIPSGALATPTKISITEESAPPQKPYVALSPVYKLEPAGTKFARPVTVAIKPTTASAHAGIFWETPSGKGYARLPSAKDGAGAEEASNTHFSDVFAGDTPAATNTFGNLTTPITLPGTGPIIVGDVNNDGYGDIVQITGDGSAQTQSQFFASYGIADPSVFTSPTSLGTVNVPPSKVKTITYSDGLHTINLTSTDGIDWVVSNGQPPKQLTIPTSGTPQSVAIAASDSSSVYGDIGVFDGTSFTTGQVDSSWNVTLGTPVAPNFAPTGLVSLDAIGTVVPSTFVLFGPDNVATGTSSTLTPVNPSGIQTPILGLKSAWDSVDSAAVGYALSSGWLVEMNFANTSHSIPLPGITNIAVSDFDRDGHPDVAVTDGTTVTVYDLSGDQLAQIIADIDVTSMTFSDIDGDGEEDLLLEDEADQEVEALPVQVEALPTMMERDAGLPDAAGDAGSAPVITSVPTAAVITQTIKILGSNFGPLPQQIVRFEGGSQGTIDENPSDNSDNDHEILVQVPLDALDGPITVIGAGGTAMSDNIRIGSNKMPAIGGVSPQGGGAGTVVELTGNSLVTTDQVFFEDTNSGNFTSCTFTVLDDNTIDVVAPLPISGFFTIHTPYLDSSLASAHWYATPTISNVTLGTACMMCDVDITGTNFDSATLIQVNGFGIDSSACSSSGPCVSETEITGTIDFAVDNQSDATSGKVTTIGGTAVWP